MKSTIFIFLLFGLIQFSVQAQICADAGKDSTVCGYTYDLFGAPAGEDIGRRFVIKMGNLSKWTAFFQAPQELQLLAVEPTNLCIM
ncbi:MAG: hypothetical protein IPG87_15500 [Saprospiraceae bacterium]|nr:hypothetical protein [Candidatus Vicinibacter affinis]